MSIILKTPAETSQELAERVRDMRLSINFSQEGLARRAGVSAGTIKRFEKTGQISLTSLLQISLVLGSLEDFDNVFKARTAAPASIDDIINQPKKAKRGRLK